MAITFQQQIMVIERRFYQSQVSRRAQIVSFHDIANYIPARLTALLMVFVTGHWRLIGFVWRNGRRHASPNSGYPEAALAGILNCRFGGPHYYFGELFDKPYIGDNDRQLETVDAKKAINVNRKTEVVMVVFVLFIQFFINFHHYG